ncbi:hypothetical protein [Paenibacillus radicis (ex Xue et al. 2023)]|uniref:Uncharacterized protein n=1 Tax=Paenibacillus radicis (ex Xue et al. 2023) TaxID=2972489 RepID=A0ABT1YDQ1_9BACL|nr:hypothetical protein [Paenibacillus radicis (ex Xue et al. 2023)]MCR8630343.1 hypothetical protein [Paenibacillus radicis (ex Xue et al. 2023)]
MKRSLGILIIIFSLVLIFSPFSPWVTESFAKSRALYVFEREWKNTQDGCGFNCKDCGFKTSQKVLFGRKVEIEFACGLLPTDSYEYHKRKELFVSFLGTVH